MGGFLASSTLYSFIDNTENGMKLEDERDNSFLTNTSIPSPTIDELAVLELQQAAVIGLSLHHPWLLYFALLHRNTSIGSLKCFSSDVHVTAGAFWLRGSTADDEGQRESRGEL